MANSLSAALLRLRVHRRADGYQQPPVTGQSRPSWPQVFLKDAGSTNASQAGRAQPRLSLGLVVVQGVDDVAEHIVNLHVERLPEGCYLATSDEVPGLVAQGRTLAETLEIARDVAKRLIEAQVERGDVRGVSPLEERFDHPLVVSA
jgi:predicted RNase H-like HicB family nuclease